MPGDLSASKVVALWQLPGTEGFDLVNSILKTTKCLIRTLMAIVHQKGI